MKSGLILVQLSDTVSVLFARSDSPFKKFPHMSSYHRMLVHRVAAYFGMEHNVDQTGKAVIINKTGNTRMYARLGVFPVCVLGRALHTCRVCSLSEGF